jgi:hypothetical protein
VLDTEGAESDLVETRSVKLALAEEVRNSQRSEVPVPAVRGEGAPIQRGVGPALDGHPIPTLRLIRPSDLEQVLPKVIALEVGDPVGPNELS